MKHWSFWSQGIIHASYNSLSVLQAYAASRGLQMRQSTLAWLVTTARLGHGFGLLTVFEECFVKLHQDLWRTWAAFYTAREGDLQPQAGFPSGLHRANWNSLETRVAKWASSQHLLEKPFPFCVPLSAENTAENTAIHSHLQKETLGTGVQCGVFSCPWKFLEHKRRTSLSPKPWACLA